MLALLIMILTPLRTVAKCGLGRLPQFNAQTACRNSKGIYLAMRPHTRSTLAKEKLKHLGSAVYVHEALLASVERLDHAYP